MSDEPAVTPRRRRPVMGRDEMCRSLVDAHSEIHDVLLHIAADRAVSEEVRARIAADFLLVPPDWPEALERIWRELSALLQEIAATAEWASTMESIAEEISEAL